VQLRSPSSSPTCWQSNPGGNSALFTVPRVAEKAQAPITLSIRLCSCSALVLHLAVSWLNYDLGCCSLGVFGSGFFLECVLTLRPCLKYTPDHISHLGTQVHTCIQPQGHSGLTRQSCLYQCIKLIANPTFLGKKSDSLCT